jgi:hypothetical protein
MGCSIKEPAWQADPKHGIGKQKRLQLFGDYPYYIYDSTEQTAL